MKKIIIELKWAIIFTIMSLVWVLLEKTLGYHEERIDDYLWVVLLFFPLAALMLYLEMAEKRRRYYIGIITYKQALLSGILMSFFVALLSSVGQYITHNYITPEYFVNVKNYSVTNQMLTIEAANDIFNINNYMLSSSFGAFLGGVLSSLILAFIVKRKVAKMSRKERRRLRKENLSGDFDSKA